MTQEQFKQKILPLRQQLFRISVNLLVREEDAEDAVQEVMLKLWAMRESLNKLDSPAAFAVTMAKNHCKDKLKLKKNVESIDNFAALQQKDNPYKQLERENTNQLLQHIIENLPPLQQQIITMKDVDEYEVEEIAAITGATPEAIRTNLSRARKKVREEYLKIMSK